MNSLENVEKFIEIFGEKRISTKYEVSLQSNKKTERLELFAKKHSTSGVIDTNHSTFQRQANIAKNAVNKINICQTLVPHPFFYSRKISSLPQIWQQDFLLCA